eukprot:TRINITY_DN57666_c0_g1_i1.p1 TRINITY_DN57666_c0_g1~~TRINITY_DN57666_c0_g1_i1.p1  ORF type:complete len:164 (+),score=51.28 TRINITY_DN57666_c0_g1_i1:61-492(+)
MAGAFPRVSLQLARASIRVPLHSVSRPGAWAPLAARSFCAASGSVEERVIKAVKKYTAMRIEELQREEGDAGAAGEREKLMEKLRSEVSADTTWEDLGFDDLDKVEVLLEVEDEFSHTMPDDEADAIPSVKETIAYIQKQKIE